MKTKNKTASFYWLGGSACAGKTTISKILSEEYGFAVYHCDDYLGKHIEMSDVKAQPNLYKAKALNWNEILGMKPEDYLIWNIALYREEFDLILRDLEELSDDKPILAEGINLLPGLLQDKITDRNHAVWVVAEDNFYINHQVHRKELYERINTCSDPGQALHNYMSFDLALGRHILYEAQRFDRKVMLVKDEEDIMKNVRELISYFGLIDDKR